MSTYKSRCRTNYFQVKDSQAFLDWVKSIQDLTLYPDKGGSTFSLHNPTGITAAADAGKVYALGSKNGWPTYEEATEKNINFSQELATFLAPGQVAILIETGFDISVIDPNDVFYCYGQATAINSEGRIETLSLDEINMKALTLAGPGVSVTPAEW